MFSAECSPAKGIRLCKNVFAKERIEICKMKNDLGEGGGGWRVMGVHKAASSAFFIYFFFTSHFKRVRSSRNGTYSGTYNCA